MCSVAPVSCASSVARCTAMLAVSEPSVPTTIDVYMLAILPTAPRWRQFPFAPVTLRVRPPQLSVSTNNVSGRTPSFFIASAASGVAIAC